MSLFGITWSISEQHISANFLVQPSLLVHFTCLKVWWSTCSHTVDLEKLPWFAAPNDIETKPSGALDQLWMHWETS